MSTADLKQRFGGILENPWVSLIQRNIVDAGRGMGLRRTVAGLGVRSVLDIGCGLGEHSRLCPDAFYLGLDNSAPRAAFAAQQHAPAAFLLADALKLPVRPGSFDLAMLIDTSHHLTDDQFRAMLRQMAVASRRWVLVSDPVFYEGQNLLSRFFYSLDRGAMFRSAATMEEFLHSCPGLVLERADMFITFPGLYRHGVFLLRRTDGDDHKGVPV